MLSHILGHDVLSIEWRIHFIFAFPLQTISIQVYDTHFYRDGSTPEWLITFVSLPPSGHLQKFKFSKWFLAMA